MPVGITLLILDIGDRCETHFKGAVLDGLLTKREKILAEKIRSIVDPILEAENCSHGSLITRDVKTID